jgi:uncharacterized membrane protein YbhN (UPF0104 family)
MLLLAKLGVDLPSATMIILVFRLCTLYFGTLLGFCLLGLWKVMSPRGKAGVAFGAGLTLRLQAQGTS